MKKIFFLSLLLVCVIANAQQYQASESFYYYNGESVALTINNNRFVVYFNTNYICLDTIKKRYTTGRELPSAKDNPSNIYACEVIIPNNNYDSVRQSLNGNNYIEDVEPVIGSETTVMVSNILYVKLRNSNDYSLLEYWANQTNSTIMRQSQYSSKWYVLKVSKQSTGSSIAVANTLAGTDLFAKVDPGFVIPFRENTFPCVTDNQITNQWGLKKIDACDAWSITKGNPAIKVAVLDQGIDVNHTDFNGVNVAGSFDAENGTQPAVIYGDHGTHVGGIIFANHDYGHVAGIAPDCSMLNISSDLVGDATLSEELANGIYWAMANGADVINNSWGDIGGFILSLHSSYLEDALDSAIDYGRDGKGCVVVFAAGNNYPNMDYPATYRREILTVGASDSNYVRRPSSAKGLLLDVVAPGSDVVTTFPNGYWGSDGGTSMAAPHVAGVAALMLSVNPNLTGQQVRDIIEQTAVKVGPYPYVDASLYGRNNGLWTVEMGYGFVNAYLAVQAAMNYDIYTRDNAEDNGSVPSNIQGNSGFNSPDIWVRNNRDGGTAHQMALMGDTNYIYVRIHNFGPAPSISDSVILYSKNIVTSSNLELDFDVWPNNWQKIAAAKIPSVPVGGESIVCLPVKFDNLFNSHTLLSKIVSDYDMLTTTETNRTGFNARYNNNISIKNSTSAQFVAALEQPGLYVPQIMAARSGVAFNPFHFRIILDDDFSNSNMLDDVEVTLILSDNLASYWQNNGITPEGLKKISDNNYLLESDDISLGIFEVPQGYDADFTLKYNFLTSSNSPITKYENTILKYNVYDVDEELVGGLTIQVEKPERAANEMFTANAGNDTAILIGTNATLHATQINEDAVYRWYDKERNFKYEGLNYIVTPDETSEYILEVTAESDGYRDLDVVKVNVVPGCIRSITPNPVADNWITVSYEYATTVTSAQLFIYNTVTTTLVGNYDLSNLDNVSSLDIEVTNYPTGSYTVVLVCDNAICHSKVLIRQ